MGTYSIAAAAGSLTFNALYSGYTIDYVSGTLTVNKATLTATADNKTRTQGQANPTFTASYSGFANNDTASVISGLSLTSPANTSSAPGTYSITASGATAANYNIDYVNGILTVTSAFANIPQTVIRVSQNAALNDSFGTASPVNTGFSNSFASSSPITVSPAPASTGSLNTSSPANIPPAPATNTTIDTNTPPVNLPVNDNDPHASTHDSLSTLSPSASGDPDAPQPVYRHEADILPAPGWDNWLMIDPELARRMDLDAAMAVQF